MTLLNQNIAADLKFYQKTGGHNDLGVRDILKAMMDISGMLNTTVALEAKLGFEASVGFKAALLEATLRIAIGGEVAFMDHTLFMEKGILWELDSDDPLYKPYSKIKKYLNINSFGEGSIRKSIERKSLLK